MVDSEPLQNDYTSLCMKMLKRSLLLALLKELVFSAHNGQ